MIDMNFIETKKLGFNYPDGTNVFKNINISIKQGEFIGILGANGTGKTTFLKLLNRLLVPTEGNIYLQDTDIAHISKDHFFSRVCTMFQNPDDQLFAATVGEDIAFGPINMGLSNYQVQERVDSALSAVEMTKYADKPIQNLSFGQKKRTCLAGVLAMTPEVMLLDEPALCLDPMGVNNIMRLLRNLNKTKNITMIMATHAVDLIPLFTDRVIVLHEGEVICQGSPKEVFAKTQLLRSAKLRLPRIGHLFEILRKKDDFIFESLPLTIGQARSELKDKLHLG